MEDLDFRSPRGLDRARSLADPGLGLGARASEYFSAGPDRTAKAFWRAPCEKACRDRFTALYTRGTQLFRDLSLARADGSLRSLLARLARLDVLVVDDGPSPLADVERRDFLDSVRTATSVAR